MNYPMEDLKESDNAITNSEKNSGLLETKQEGDSVKLKNRSNYDHIDDTQNMIRGSELNSILSENKIVKNIGKTSDNSVLNDDFFVNLLVTNSSSSADSSELGKNSEEKVELEYIESTPGSSLEKEINETDLKTDVHSKATDAVVTNLISSSHECTTNDNLNADLKEVSVVETRSSNPAMQPVKININNGYRCDSDSWSDDDDDSSSTSDTSSDSDFFQMMVDSFQPKKVPIVKTKGELGLEDLPPIEDLIISVKEEEMTIVGKIHAIVDKLVVIRAIKDMKPLDLDSVLFLSHDKPLGRVFDVFGPVVEPFYCVRFNSTDDIKIKGVEIGSGVFFAPEKNDITTYVFVDELQRQKGSDASWSHNNEPPEECLDFSDDEEEKAARRRRIAKNRNQQFSNDSDIASKRPSLANDSSPQSNNRNYNRPAFVRNNTQVHSFQFPRQNPFSTPLPPPSPTPSICSIMSTPVRVQNSFNHFATPNQPRLPFSSLRRPLSQRDIMQSSSSPLLLASYQQPPPVFGQMAVLSPMPSLMHSQSPLHSPVMSNIPTFIPTSHLPLTPQSYFNQRFPRNPPPLSQVPQSHIYLDQGGYSRSPSPVPQIQHSSPDPWLHNRMPGHFHVPPNHPLTVQIPNSAITQNNPMHTFQSDNIPLQPFVNNNINIQNNNMQSRFY